GRAVVEGELPPAAVPPPAGGPPLASVHVVDGGADGLGEGRALVEGGEVVAVQGEGLGGEGVGQGVLLLGSDELVGGGDDHGAGDVDRFGQGAAVVGRQGPAGAGQVGRVAPVELAPDPRLEGCELGGAVDGLAQDPGHEAFTRPAAQGHLQEADTPPQEPLPRTLPPLQGGGAE